MAKRWTNNKELNEMIDAVLAQGWEIRDGNHWVLRPADKTQSQIAVSKTPSDRRGIKNTRAQIRRAGGIV